MRPAGWLSAGAFAPGAVNIYLVLPVTVQPGCRWSLWRSTAGSWSFRQGMT
jgi:hypothetical protein